MLLAQYYGNLKHMAPALNGQVPREPKYSSRNVLLKICRMRYESSKFFFKVFRQNATHCISLYAIVVCVCVCVCVCMCRVCGRQENSLR